MSFDILLFQYLFLAFTISAASIFVMYLLVFHNKFVFIQ
jgi:hypothetical protein